MKIKPPVEKMGGGRREGKGVGRRGRRREGRRWGQRAMMWLLSNHRQSALSVQ